MSCKPTYKGKRFDSLQELKASANSESKLFDSILNLPDVNSKEEALAIWARTKTPEFKKWFGDSQVVDENGEPLLVYHGSEWEFNEFESQTEQDTGGLVNSGYFFSESKTHPYVKGRSELYPVFLAANNSTTLEGELHHMTAQEANQEGFNGVTGTETYGDRSYKTWAVFENNQIKSSFNSGEFSGDSNIYHSLSEKDLNFYDMQVNQDTTTIEQKQVVEKILAEASKVALDPSGEGYHVKGFANLFERVSSKMSTLMDGYFAFNKEENEEEPYEANRDWGNVLHRALEFTITENPNAFNDLREEIDQLQAEGKDFDISDNVLRGLLTSFKKFKEKYPNSIILSEIPVANSDIEVAGTVDIMIVSPNGTVSIVDLKSSLDPILTPYVKTTKKGYKITNNYMRRFTKEDKSYSASKKERHTAQLTIYQSMLESMGLTVSGIGVLPLHITKVEGNDVVEARIETNNSVYTHHAEPNILNAFKSKSKEKFDENSKSTFINDSLLEGLIATLEAQIKLFRKNDNYREAKRIQNIKEKIEVLNTANELNKLIDELHDIFTSEDGHYAQFQTLVDNVKDGLYDDVYDAINELRTYQQEATMYSDLIKDLRYELRNSGAAAQKGSALAKLGELSGTLGDIETEYRKVINPLIADKLTENFVENSTTIENANKMISKLTNINNKHKEELENPNISERRKRRLNGTIVNNNNKIGKYQLATESGYKKAVLDQLNKGSYKDISVLEASIISPIMNSNLLIKSFMKTLKDAYEEFRYKLHLLEKESSKIFDEFANYKGNQDDVAKFNEDIIEKTEGVDGTESWGFVQKINFSKYLKERKVIADEVEKYNQTATKRKDLNKELYLAKVRIRRPNADITVTNPETGKVTILMKGLDTIYTEKQEQLTKTEFNRWMNNNATMIDNELVLVGRDVTMANDVKYLNPKYTKLQSNEAALKYYEYTLSVHFESQEGLPRRLRYTLPQIEKDNKDRRREQGMVKTAKRIAKDSVTQLSIDEEDFGKGTNNVLLLYTSDIGVENVSLDVMASILQYREASERYKVNYKLQGFANSTLDVVKEANPLSDNNEGYAKALSKIPMFNKYLKDYNGNNVAAALNSLIDMHIYGKRKELATLELGGKKFNMNKIAATIMGMASFTQIGGDPVLAVANSLTANTSARIEAFGNKYFGLQNWAQAATIYTANEKEFLVDAGRSAKFGKVSQLLELYDALQGEYLDEYGRKMSHSKVKKFFSKSTWFSMMHKGEHRAQTKTMIATLLNSSALDGNGNTTSLYDAYVVKDNKLTIKEGYTDMDGKPLKLVNASLKNKIHAVAREAQGVYNSFDKTLLQRHWLGEMLMMYKKFIIPGVTRRFRGLQFSVETDDFTEGYYRTFYNAARNEGLGLFKELYSKDSTLTPLEKENVRKTLGEILTMMVYSTLAFIFVSMRAKLPPEKRTLLTYLAYFSIRTTSELSFFNMGLGDVRNGMLPLNINPTLKSFRTPFATYSFITKLFKNSADATMLLTGEGRYERDMKYTVPFLGNIADKGDPKVWKGTAKLIGLSDKMGNMDEALKIIEGFQ